jgi:hypothetical protein
LSSTKPIGRFIKENALFLLIVNKKEVKMPKAKSRNVVGAWAFLIGVILAILLGLFSAQLAGQTWLIILLVVVGILVGLLNISGKEVKDFLFIGAVLVLVGKLGGDALFGIKIIGPILAYLVILFTPATIVVAIKAAFSLANK